MGPAPADSDDGGPDYELNAEYSSSTLEGGRFPATVADFGPVESLIQNELILFGESDHFGFDLSTSGYSSAELSTVDNSSEDRTSGRHSAQCWSDGSSNGVVDCQTDESLGTFVPTSDGVGPDGTHQSGHQSSSPWGPSAPSGGLYLSAQQMLSLEMIAAQNMTWEWNMSQAAFTPPCGACDPILPIAGASTSDFVDPTWSPVNSTWRPNSDSTSIRPKSALFATSVEPPAAPSANSDPTWDPPTGGPWGPGPGVGPSGAVPEIPQWAMWLIGFGGLSLLGRRRLRRSARIG